SGVEIAATRDADGLARDVAAAVAGEEEDQLGDLGGLARPLQRRPLLSLHEELGRIDAAEELVVDKAGRDGIDANAVGGRLGGSPLMPESLTRMSRWPKWSIACLTTASTRASSVTSSGRPITSLPVSFPISSATSAVRRSCLSVTTTPAPASASRRAAALPMPAPAAAVTSATFPSSSN